jgi:hypothetical protein
MLADEKVSLFQFLKLDLLGLFSAVLIPINFLAFYHLEVFGSFLTIISLRLQAAVNNKRKCLLH